MKLATQLGSDLLKKKRVPKKYVAPLRHIPDEIWHISSDESDKEQEKILDKDLTSFRTILGLTHYKTFV